MHLHLSVNWRFRRQITITRWMTPLGFGCEAICIDSDRFGCLLYVAGRSLVASCFAGALFKDLRLVHRLIMYELILLCSIMSPFPGTFKYFICLSNAFGAKIVIYDCRRISALHMIGPLF